MKKSVISILIICLGINPLFAQLPTNVKKAIENIETKTIQWRHHLHQHPELGNNEIKTATFIANHLKELGLEVKTGVAKTGVVGILKTTKPGPVIGLRADIDALPILEKSNLPHASKQVTDFKGEKVPVMHACGHDTHISILMATAEVLVGIKNELTGTIKFIFQPAEEGPPPGEEGGAKLMVDEGVMENPKVDAIYGLHIWSNIEVGKIAYKPGPFMASTDEFSIKIKGKGAHGSAPWAGTDPIIVATQVMTSLQHIVSRESDLTIGPVILSVGKIKSGIRWNVIPDDAEMEGTIRTFDNKTQEAVHQKIKQKAESIAAAYNAKAEVKIETRALTTFNDYTLTDKTVPTLKKALGNENVYETTWVTGGEDFSYYGTKAPAFFFFLGGMKKGNDPKKAPLHHTPEFEVEDSAMKYGIEAFCAIVWDQLRKK